MEGGGGKQEQEIVEEMRACSEGRAAGAAGAAERRERVE